MYLEERIKGTLTGRKITGYSHSSNLQVGYTRKACFQAHSVAEFSSLEMQAGGPCFLAGFQPEIHTCSWRLPVTLLMLFMCSLLQQKGPLTPHLSLISASSKASSHDQIGPTGIIQDNPPILRSVTLITFAKSF